MKIKKRSVGDPLPELHNKCFQQGCQNGCTLVLVHTEAGHHNLLAPSLLLPVVQPGQVIIRVASVLCVLTHSCHFSMCIVLLFYPPTYLLQLL